jgi:hypothetical protein
VSALLPVLILSVYFIVTRSGATFAPSGDTAALIIAVLVGVACVALVPTRWSWRVVVCAAYAFAMTFVLGFYSLVFVCEGFGDCL